MAINGEWRASGADEGAEAARLYARGARRVERERLKSREVQDIPRRLAALCERRLAALHARGLLLADAGEARWFSRGVDVRLKYGDDFVDVPALRLRAPASSWSFWNEDALGLLGWACHRAARALLGERAYFDWLWGKVAKALARSESERAESEGRPAPGLAAFGEALELEASCPPRQRAGRSRGRI